MPIEDYYLPWYIRLWKFFGLCPKGLLHTWKFIPETSECKRMCERCSRVQRYTEADMPFEYTGWKDL